MFNAFPVANRNTNKPQSKTMPLVVRHYHYHNHTYNSVLCLTGRLFWVTVQEPKIYFRNWLQARQKTCLSQNWMHQSIEGTTLRLHYHTFGFTLIQQKSSNLLSI